ncbi:hypothetical protein RJT34_03435 [Clitoria ternatea]|uniref:Leucine-rich repeat-containing N-terminal plant-type domain-containing protein n=1 Tax=Clitoria ternatea TaxID=43366 RepID=A0AAN9KM47_CLITE
MIVHGRFLQHLVEFIAILHLSIQGHFLCNAVCMESEAEALLQFKGGLNDLTNRLSSWERGEDCCQWNGVGCNTSTGHVISLDLFCANSLHKLQGHLSSSLLELPYLSSLNLSGNDFMQSQVPSFLGTMRSLKHLDLSNANFKGNLPKETLGNLSHLESLNLSGNDYSLQVNNLKWLRGLSSLKTLDLSGVVLGSSTANDWFLDISMLLSLVTLRLSGCQLHKLPPSSEVNFDSLITLDLSFNYFGDTIPDWLFENCHNLQHLNLSHNHFRGPIPDSVGRLMSLVTLDLSNNQLIGSIPSTLGNGHTQNPLLKELHLSNNQLNGSLDGSLERSLGQLSQLVVLKLAWNKLEGNITSAHLANFNNLKVLDLSFNSIRMNRFEQKEKRITLHVSKNWIPPFQLETIGLGFCELGPQFPMWIQTQKNFSYVDISDAGIFDIVPDWFWDFSPTIEYMNLSSNELRGCEHDFSQKFKLETLDLSNNNFSCPLPRLPPNLRTLNLATNSFHGNISRVCEMLGVNNSLGFLDLSSNKLSGNIPNCWSYGGNMIILNLGKNTFSGPIPDSLGSLTSLHILSMQENNLYGKIPDSLKNLQVVTILDLGGNRLSGPIPYWIGGEMHILKSLILRNNYFEENIPITLCMLKSLKILDLSGNKLTGAIPPCVFEAMATEESLNDFSYMEYQTIKGSLSMYQFRSSPWFLNALDLSSNLLTEEIPLQITELVVLVALNLSRNQLVGSIPYGIGEMRYLEFLDFSRNHLSCVIPSSMLRLHFLSALNLSYNNLSGKIPHGFQFDTFDVSSYEGNPDLCGNPLIQECSTNISFEDMHCIDSEGSNNRERENDEHEDNVGTNAFYISMVIGFITGFWVFWGSLFLITPWRYAYFRFLSSTHDWIYCCRINR